MTILARIFATLLHVIGVAVGPAFDRLMALTASARAARRSQSIDRMLEADAQRRQEQYSVMSMGAFKEREVVEQFKHEHAGFIELGLTEGELIGYGWDVRQWVVDCTRALLGFIEETQIQLAISSSDHVDYLRMHITDLDPSAPLDGRIGTSLEALWKDASIIEALESNSKTSLTRPARYLSEEIDRITTPDYIPMEIDIVQSYGGYIPGAREHRFFANGLAINLIDPGFQCGERRKWAHVYNSATAILYVANMLVYDEVLCGVNSLNVQLEIFDSVVNSKNVAGPILILFLSGVSALRRKLEQSPLEAYFDDYRDGADADRACEYLRQRFEQTNRRGRKIYSYVVDPYDPSNMQLVAAAIKDSMTTTSE